MKVFADLFLKKINGITDTEDFVSIGLWFMDDSEFMPVITQRKKENLKQYYLFDFLKIWQHKIIGEIDD